MDKEKKGNLVFTLIASLLFAFFCIPAGLWVITWTVDAEKKAESSRTWSTVAGTVTGTEIITYTSVDDGPSYDAHVTYSYTVDGREFSSSSFYLSCANSYPKKEKAEQCLLNYPVGKEVTVHYDPQNPRQAALNIAVAPPNGCLYAFGTAFILMGLLPALTFLLDFRKSRLNQHYS